MGNCTKYDSLDARRSRCKELGLCLLCASPHHITDSCPDRKNKMPRACKFCNSRGHINPLCKKSFVDKGDIVSTHLCTNTVIREAV